MLTALGIGLASGVGLYMLAGFGALFVLGVLWVVESFEPNATKLFTLKVTTKEPEKLKEPIERLLRQNRAEFDLRTTSADEVCYEVQLPIDRRTETVSKRILSLANGGEVGVEWSERKAK
jgi:uncharacterized membrane protein YhiD involved in acid resistance